MASGAWLALDVGERRIGVAWADQGLRIAFPLATVEVEKEADAVAAIAALCTEKDATGLVVGLPRNQQGEETAQTQRVKAFAELLLAPLGLPLYFQDESLTSVQAEKELESRGKPYTKADVDSLAATFILQDFLESGAK